MAGHVPTKGTDAEEKRVCGVNILYALHNVPPTELQNIFSTKLIVDILGMQCTYKKFENE